VRNLRLFVLLPLLASATSIPEWQSAVAAPASSSHAATPSPGAANIANIDDCSRRVAALRPQSHVWRQIHWKNTLTNALDESRRTQKPVLAWIFGGNPGSERC
jgi:hypothetical protein